MKIINLRTYYPQYYRYDLWIEVSDMVAECFEESRKAERAQRERDRSHRAYFSLDAGDGIERKRNVFVESPEAIYLKMIDLNELKAAIDKLPWRQRLRLWKHCVEGMPEIELARLEGVVVPAISHSVKKGRNNLKKLLKKE